MVIQRILLVIDRCPPQERSVELALALARAFGARLFALHVLPAGSPDQEEAGWRCLYDIEDRAFDREVKISLLLEEGELDARLSAGMETFRIDLVVVTAAAGSRLAALRGAVPVLLVP